jgi:predicted acetyltransferase
MHDGSAAGTINVRALDDEATIVAAARLFRTAMVGLPSTVPIDGDFVRKTVEEGRIYGAFLAGELAGTVESYAAALTVPGYVKVPHAAVTHLGVLPTHRRRGLATALLARLFRDARAEGEVAASLRASDARIYENFGFGIATTAMTAELLKDGARPRGDMLGGGEVRLSDAAAAWDLLPAVDRRRSRPRAGTVQRPRRWWTLQKLRHRASAMPGYAALYGPAGAETGFVRYRPTETEGWFTSRNRTVVIDDLVADDAETYRALIGHLLSIDIAHRLVFSTLPIDDPLPWLFEDCRSVRVLGVRDETWLRLLNVEKALRLRCYAEEGSRDGVRLQIADALLPENNVMLLVARDGVERTTGRPDARVDVAGLSAAYLGGVRWWQLAQAGRVEARDPSVIAALDGLFQVGKAPFAGFGF